MGIMLRDGMGIEANVAKSFEWMQKAANANYPHAYLDLGVYYSDGIVVEKNVAEAVRLWRICAASGNSECAFYAGQLLFYGRGVPVDIKSAVTLIRQAAESKQPVTAAQTMLGGLYLDGRGVSQDYVKARTFLEKGAAYSDSSALHNLALIYQNGYGVAVDKTKAISLYQRAARLNNSSSLNNLGYIYRNGEGVATNLEMAFKYFYSAHKLGNLDATDNMS